ncbi:hypothetical protein BDV59DRAFT_43926 [Aspergillus ambiguus]|uniref:uncharacterized protein n=1 Tax=Aspergillus ambiguus TaxID=176160 RepID=UPI003CCD3787
MYRIRLNGWVDIRGSEKTVRSHNRWRSEHQGERIVGTNFISFWFYYAFFVFFFSYISCRLVCSLRY